MLLVNNHFTLVLGIDIHFTTLPPYIPVHPYIGMVLDPSDFIPFIGSTVNINGVPRGVSDTSGIIVPLVHIPLPSPPWLLAPIIGHESTNFFASQTVFADGSRLSPKGYMVMTCNDIGVPLSLQPGTKKPWKVVPTLFAPTSYSLPLVTGAPVNVGGPYVPDWGGMLKNMAMGLGFGGLLKAGKKIKPNRLNDKAARLMSGDKSVLPEPKFSKNTDNIVPLPKPSKVDDVSKKIDNPQKQIIDDVNSGKTPLEGYEGHKVGNHTRKSNYGEMNTDLKMESITEIDGKPASLTALHEKITDIDTPIKQGIDHIYQNATPPPKYVIAESKYGSSTLNPKTKDGPQMSDDWIKGSDRLEKAIEDIDIVDDIRFNLDNNPENVQKVLSEVDKSGNVTIYKINPDGSKGDLWL